MTLFKHRFGQDFKRINKLNSFTNQSGNQMDTELCDIELFTVEH